MSYNGTMRKFLAPILIFAAGALGSLGVGSTANAITCSTGSQGTVPTTYMAKCTTAGYQHRVQITCRNAAGTEYRTFYGYWKNPGIWSTVQCGPGLTKTGNTLVGWRTV